MRMIAYFLVLILISSSCDDDAGREPRTEKPEQTDLQSTCWLVNEKGDTISNKSFGIINVGFPGGATLTRMHSDSLTSTANRMKLIRLDSSSAEGYGYKSGFGVEMKYFSYEEIGNPSYYLIPFDPFYQILENEVQEERLNISPHRIDLKLILANEAGVRYTNLPREGSWEHLGGRFSNARESFKVKVHQLDSINVHGIFDSEYYKFARMQCGVEGYLVNEDNWTDSIYVKGEMDIFFTSDSTPYFYDQ